MVSTHPGKLITFANSKGGSGKSTFAISFLQYLRQLFPAANVLALDADDDYSMFHWIREVPPTYVLDGPSVGHAREQFDFFRIDIHRSPEDLQRIVGALMSTYDYIIADVVGYAHPVARSLASLSNLVVIPVEPTMLGMGGLPKMLDVVAGVKNLLFFNRVADDPNDVIAGSPDGDVIEGLESVATMVNRHWPVFEVATEFLHNSQYLNQVIAPAGKPLPDQTVADEAPAIQKFRNQMRLVNERIFSELSE